MRSFHLRVAVFMEQQVALDGESAVAVGPISASPQPTEET